MASSERICRLCGVALREGDDVDDRNDAHATCVEPELRDTDSGRRDRDELDAVNQILDTQ